LVASLPVIGAEIGIISILHPWGQNLLLHPHIHCVIPAGKRRYDQMTFTADFSGDHGTDRLWSRDDI